MDNSNICTKPEDINATMKIAQKMHHSLANVCNSPCTTMQVFAVGDNKFKAKSGHPQLVLVFQSRIQNGQEQYLYTILTLIAEVGGYVGLILGYSLLNVAEFLVALFRKYKS